MFILTCCDKSLQSFLTLCNPMYYSMPGSSVHMILQTRTLEWVASPPCPPPGDFPDLGTELTSLPSLQWQVGSLPLVPPGKPFSAQEG